MANRLLRDDAGATLIEFTVVLPLLIMVTMGLVDLGLLMFTRSDANRAVQHGARCAVTNNPVAAGINGPVTGVDSTVTIGTSCNDGTSNTYCTARPEYTCTALQGSGGTCKVTAGSGSTLTINDTDFDRIVNAMQPFGNKLDRRQVVITYTPLKQGFVGQSSTPMNVTVSLRCVAQPLFFIGGLVGWALGDLTGCSGIPNANGIPIPASATLPNEDLTSDTASDTKSCVPRS